MRTPLEESKIHLYVCSFNFAKQVLADDNCSSQESVPKKSLLGPASTAFVCNVSEKGDRIHRCMHCSLRKDLRCMHSLFERRRPGHASLFDRGLVSPVRCRKHVLNYRGMLLMDAPNGCVDRNDCIRIDADVFAVLLCSCSLAEICNSLRRQLVLAT